MKNCLGTTLAFVTCGLLAAHAAQPVPDENDDVNRRGRLALPDQATNGLLYLTTTTNGMPSGYRRITLNGVVAPFIYDLFRLTNFSTLSWELYVPGTWNQTHFDVPDSGGALYQAGWALDRDDDGLSDGYESIITKNTMIDLADSDDDGIPDGWEVFHGLNPTNSVDGKKVDANGISNLQKYLTETALLNPSEPLGPCSRRTPLVISEIMYHPATGSQFVELFNSGFLTVNLSGYRLYDPDRGQAYANFAANTSLAPGGFLAVTPTVALSIVDGMGKLELRGATGEVLLHIEYSAQPPWPKQADGAGHSLVLARPSFGENDVRAWAASEKVGGSRGLAEPKTFSPLRAVRINEFLANPRAGAHDFIELFNASAQSIDISGCYLSCRSNQLTKFRIPNGTVIAGREFVVFDEGQLGFSLNKSGEGIYFTSPDESRVIDAFGFGPQEDGMTTGRVPDGGLDFRVLASSTSGGTNTGEIRRNLVISEIMFNPIGGNNAVEYVEICNRGTTNQPLTHWMLKGGISLTNINATLAPGASLAIVKNTNAFATAYPDRIFGVDFIGEYRQQLGNRSDLVKLVNSSAITISEVRYDAGSRWGKWSDGAGSSLELADIRSSARLASNWSDSAAPTNAAWIHFAYTNTVQLGYDLNPNDFNALEISLLGAGECVVDNVAVFAGTTRVNDNGDFSSGTSGWFFEGNHDGSILTTTAGVGGGNALLLRTTGRGDYLANRVRTDLTTKGLTNGVSCAITGSVRWLRGNNELLLRLRGNGLETTAVMPIPMNSLGTPGRTNSIAVTNAGPALHDVGHFPILPAGGKPVLVSTRVHDPDGVTNLVLWYRVDPSTNLSKVLMRDDGTGGDALAGDGLFSATIPGQSSGALVAFHVEGKDSFGATTRFPHDAPARECLVRFGDPAGAGTFGTYRLWMTARTASDWATRVAIHNGSLDATFVYNSNRVIYNVGARYRGSDVHSPNFDSPTNKLCGYVLEFPSDDRFLGSAEATLDWASQDDTAEREPFAHWLSSQLGLPHCYQRYVHMVVNGRHQSTRPAGTGVLDSRIYKDIQQPGGDYLEEWYPDGEDGDLYKIENLRKAYAFANTAGLWPSSLAIPATLELFTNNAGMTNLASYRWTWRKRDVMGSANAYSNLFSLVSAVNTATNAGNYVTAIESKIDSEQWLRNLAAERVVGNTDSYAYRSGHNMYAYQPALPGTPFVLFLVDLERGTGGLASDAPNADLFATSPGADPRVKEMQGHPAFQRAYWRAFRDAINGPMQGSNFNAVLDGTHSALQANDVRKADATPGTPVASPDGIKDWIHQRRTFLSQELANVSTTFAITNNGGINYSNSQTNIVLGGTAPIEIRFLRLNNNVTTRVTWPTVTNWQLNVTLSSGQNTLWVSGYDRLTNFMPNYHTNIVMTRSP